VRRRLARTADRAGAGLPDGQYGYGVVDPYSAVTAILPDESGPRAAGPAPAGLTLPRPPSPDTGPTTAALKVLGVAAGLVVLAALASLVAVRGRSRRWQPAG
jgi:membrane-anchored mycosin MYCP